MEFISDVVRSSGTIMLAFAFGKYLEWERLPTGFFLKAGLVFWFAAAGIGVAIH